MVKLSLFTDGWELKEPFSTAQATVSQIETITACLSQGGQCGKGEALGVDYFGETAATMAEQIEAVRHQIEPEPGGTDITRDELADLMPPGGARNAIDCALWDLYCKQSGERIWDLVNAPAQPVHTVFTLSMDSVEAMAREAAKKLDFPILKLKLGPDDTAAKLEAIHAANPAATLVIDANETWSLALMDDIADKLGACNVAMLEQPLPAGKDQGLEGISYTVPLCADESCQSSLDLETVSQRYQMANIKLDKCGGLTEGMQMVKWCQKHGLELMVGNMLGSSLAMAPAWVIAQYCRFVDLDGPLWQKTDRTHPMTYNASEMSAPDSRLWG